MFLDCRQPDVEIWETMTVMNTERLQHYIERACERGLLNWLPDKPFLHVLYWARLGKRLNLKNPQTFNEKMQWLKLYNRKPEYTRMVDKYEAKRYIAEKIGAEYVIPTLGVWDRFEDIDFEALPDRFVLKCTHDSGGLVVVRDKKNLDMAAAKQKIEKSLKTNYYFHGREWPYKNVSPRIIAESYIEDMATGDLRDYKWYCFHGVPKLMAIFCGRAIGATTVDYFDLSLNAMDLTWGYKKASVAPKKPETFEEMKKLAAVLSKEIPCLRVDFYEVDGHAYVGELTFFDGSGFDIIEPKEWDEKMGSWIKLPM